MSLGSLANEYPAKQDVECEATVSTVGANHNIMSNRITERRHLWKHHHMHILLWI